MGVNMNDPIRLRGEVRTYVFDGDLPFAENREHLSTFVESGAAARLATSFGVSSNLVVNLGRERMTKLIVGESTATASHIALSTSAITPALTDTVATITDRIYTQALTIAQSYLTYYQRYVAYYTTTSFGSTGVATAALLDAASTAAATNLWADASISVAKSTTQSLICEWQVQAST